MRNRILGERSGRDIHFGGRLVVLPLENLSRDPEQEYFADGMTDELTTDWLAHARNLIKSRVLLSLLEGPATPMRRSICSKRGCSRRGSKGGNTLA
jgi:hypothetical protein